MCTACASASACACCAGGALCLCKAGGGKLGGWLGGQCVSYVRCVCAFFGWLLLAQNVLGFPRCPSRLGAMATYFSRLVHLAILQGGPWTLLACPLLRFLATAAGCRLGPVALLSDRCPSAVAWLWPARSAASALATSLVDCRLGPVALHSDCCPSALSFGAFREVNFIFTAPAAVAIAPWEPTAPPQSQADCPRQEIDFEFPIWVVCVWDGFCVFLARACAT